MNTTRITTVLQITRRVLLGLAPVGLVVFTACGGGGKDAGKDLQANLAALAQKLDQQGAAGQQAVAELQQKIADLQKCNAAGSQALNQGLALTQAAQSGSQSPAQLVSAAFSSATSILGQNPGCQDAAQQLAMVLSHIDLGNSQPLMNTQLGCNILLGILQNSGQSLLASNSSVTQNQAQSLIQLVNGIGQAVSMYGGGAPGAAGGAASANVSVYNCPWWPMVSGLLNVSGTTVVTGGNVSGAGNNYVATGNFASGLGQTISGSGGSIFTPSTTITAGGTGTTTGTTSVAGGTGGSIFTSSGGGTAAGTTLGGSIASMTGTGRSLASFSGTSSGSAAGSYNFMGATNPGGASVGTANFGLGTRGLASGNLNAPMADDFFSRVSQDQQQAAARRPTIGSRIGSATGQTMQRGLQFEQDAGFNNFVTVH